MCLSNINAFFSSWFWDSQCVMICFIVVFHLPHFPHYICVLLCFVVFHLVVRSRGPPELRSSFSWSSTTETHATLPIKALSFLLTNSLKLTDKQVKTQIKMCQEMDLCSTFSYPTSFVSSYSEWNIKLIVCVYIYIYIYMCVCVYIYMKSSFPKRDKRQIKKKWVRHAILLCTEPIHCSFNVSCQIAIFPCLKCTARCSSFPNRYKRRTCF